jgi:hypothetical protein
MNTANRARHRSVVVALRAYAETPHGERWGKCFDKEQKRQNAVDLLANLRHFCDVEGLDFAELDRAAYRHYSAEVGR